MTSSHLSSGPVVVIGAGIVGLCAAEAISREAPDREIVILDPPMVGNSGASFGNGGIIVPSHFVPLADPGLLRSGLKMMLSPTAPFGLQKFPDLAMLGWIFRFMRAATKRQAEAAGPLLRDLNLASRTAYESLIQHLQIEPGYAQKGLVMLCRTQASLDGEAHLVERANQLGLGAKVLSTAEIRALEPGLTLECQGGVLFEDDAHLTPKILMESLHGALAKRKVSFVAGKAKAFETVRGQVTSVTTESGEKIAGDQFVVASGAWVGPLAQSLGVRLPMLSGKGYGITAHAPEETVVHPMILTEARVAVTPMLDGVRFVGTLELGPPSETINQARVGGFLDSVANYLPKFKGLDRKDIWVGNRPCTPDGMPYLGKLPNHPNVVIAAGHAMMGMSLGPVTGDLVADLISARQPRISLDRLDPLRFS
jgi:D-amino-acid dehydrogenase